MKVIDLFSGIGGFSLAAHWMGWETIAFCEMDKFCQKVLRKNFDKGIPIYDDVRTFPGKSFRGRCDIVTGGFPCQPFSAAGKRQGRDDERHLFPAMLEVIRDVRPSWVVAENVRGLLSIESGKVFSEVITSLEGEGYEVVTFCVPASAVEAPHRRDRLWFVGHSANNAEDPHLSSTDPAKRTRQPGESPRPEWPVSGTNGQGVCVVTDPESADWRGLSKRAAQKYSVARFTDRDAAHAAQFGLQGGIQSRGEERPQPSHEWLHERDRDPNGWGEDWPEVAARLCRMDARVSQRVDRLKSLGNSIVPQIAYEIFKAIEAAEMSTHAQR